MAVELILSLILLWHKDRVAHRPRAIAEHLWSQGTSLSRAPVLRTAEQRDKETGSLKPSLGC